MRMCCCLLLAACQSVPVTVGAAPEDEGTRVFFRRDADIRSDGLARLSSDGGRLTQITHAPDGSAVSALRIGSGSITCTFPGGGRARFEGAAERGTSVEYVFLDSPGVEVTARVPRGCPLVPALALRIRLEASLLPATLHLPAGPVRLARQVSRVVYPLRKDKRARLVRGDHWVRIETSGNKVFSFAVGIDSDGVPAAVHGYVRNWNTALD